MRFICTAKTFDLEPFTVNPLIDMSGPSLAPTAYLPYDLQLWWNIYHKVHATTEDNTQWAMVTVMDDSRKLCNLEVIKSTLDTLVTHFLPVVGAGESKFTLIRFRSPGIKKSFSNNTRLDRGVYALTSATVKTTLMIFNLEPISPLAPLMSSILVTVTGLPLHLGSRDFCQRLVLSYNAHSSNDRLKITQIREPFDSPTYSFHGGRLFEMVFEREAAFKWFGMLSQEFNFMPMTPWDTKGIELVEPDMITRVQSLPMCGTCSTSSYDAAHRTLCPYIKIREDLLRSVKNPYKRQSKEPTSGPSQSSSTQPSQNASVKSGGFTRRD